MVERLHKLGDVPADRAELMLEALAALLETKELQSQQCPRGHFPSRPPVQIYVHEDAAVCNEGGRNTTTIPPRVRREVMARDQHRCQAPGCGRTRFLEVHHIVSRQQGGSNHAENLMTLCASCHRLWHERGGPAVVDLPAAVAP